MKRLGGLVLTLIASWIAPSPAAALPTMIRLGYNNCAACHIAPQGGGLLNDYGRVIDEAQSLRSNEYRPSENALVKALSAKGRILQDLRTTFNDRRASPGVRRNRDLTNEGAWSLPSHQALGA